MSLLYCQYYPSVYDMHSMIYLAISTIRISGSIWRNSFLAALCHACFPLVIILSPMLENLEQENLEIDLGKSRKGGHSSENGYKTNISSLGERCILQKKRISTILLVKAKLHPAEIFLFLQF